MHTVTFASPPLAGIESEQTADVISATGVSRFVPISPGRRTLRSFGSALAQRKPHFFVAAKDLRFERMIERGDLGEFDVIHLDGLVAFNYFEAARDACKKVSVDLRDAWSLLYTRILSSKRGADKVYTHLKLKLLERVEREVVDKATELIVISDVDRNYLAEKYNRDRESIRVVANGVESHPIQAEKVKNEDDPRMKMILLF
ncbi:glycosyltransferase [Cupriavidus basilensis]|uniref:glycosyltransferase n=1 Tax=Cupriavidus basilensis TaxID=68895 RepID=UPI0009D95743|nr:glycosyltransferase [Cupriavidus basilensis]